MTREPLIDLQRFEKTGLNWREYLDCCAAGRGLQEKRYHEQPDPETVQLLHDMKNKPVALILNAPRCADGAWSVPYIVRLLDEAHFTYRLFPKENHPELMDKLLTDGKRSVPKVAFLDNEGCILKTWGPRTAIIQEYVNQSVGKMDKSEWFPNVLEYYRSDGKADLYQEIRELFL